MQKLSFYNLTLSFISLMTFWVIMSGFLDAIHIGFGVFSVLSVLFVNHKLKSHRFFDDDLDDLKKLRLGRAVYYLFWMIYQILIAGFNVLFIITRPKMPVKPAVLTFRADLPSAHAKMILGNSITLTPGTLTIEINGDLFTVHALDKKSYEGIVSDEMPRQVLKLFSTDKRQVIHDLKITSSRN